MSRRGLLGAGLVEVPPVPYRDPASAVLSDPQVSEQKRYCGACNEPVGRGQNGVPGRTEGFCRNCGNAFSFTPKLTAGEVVAGQYEVLGAIAHGGLGWIYLARDRNVSDRWVVLKGLLDSSDPDAMAAAVAERRFLAEVEHPTIVKIYNFVQHRDTGYIVMEYIGGQSLKEITLARRANGEGSLPLRQAIAYALEILPALGYLHSVGLVYCDFKPDNVVQTEEQLKLIDLGGVHRIEDEDSPVYGTVGYQAPEIAAEGPSVSSDLYTVGRTLAVLSFDFHGYTSTYRDRLPDRDRIALLQQHESFDRLLRRATHSDPDIRFQSADEMATQLTGVLREVLAAEDGVARTTISVLFGPELGVPHADAPPAHPIDPHAAAVLLPVPRVDPADPAAVFLMGLAALPTTQLVAALQAAPVESGEVVLAATRALVMAKDLSGAQKQIEDFDADWRSEWYRGLIALTGADTVLAQECFDAVYDTLPGEPAPKLALALTAECAGDLATAQRYYEVVWRTDTSFVSAAFGLARVRFGRGDRDGAVAALGSVPANSSYYTAAQIAAVAMRTHGRLAGGITFDELVEAGKRLETLTLGVEQRARLAADILASTLGWLHTVRPTLATPVARVVGTDLTEHAVRAGLERAYRTLAHLAAGREARIALVDRANAIRPRTLW